jgi:hypothetical protein
MPTDNKWNRRISASVLSLAFLAVVSAAHSQTTRYVSIGGSDSGDCSNPANPCDSIAYAFAEADAGDVIDIAAGSYRPDPGPPLAALVIDKAIMIQGAGPEHTLVGRGLLSPEPEYRIFTIEAGGFEVTISDLTIFNGLVSGGGAAGRGGGIYNLNNGGQLTLSNVKFQNNHARIGGGLSNFNGASVIMENVVFESNQADERGGAIYNWTDGAIEISAGQFELNTAGIFAGAIFNNLNNQLKIEGVEFKQNQGLWGCGAIAMNGAHPDSTFSDVQFVNNESGGVGGAVCLDNSSPTLTNVDFVGNEAHAINSDAHGGGMRSVNNSSPTLTHVTFTSNKADNMGGGMYSANGGSPELAYVEFVGNESGAEGGGMANLESHPTLLEVQFIENTGLHGGGISNQSGSNPTLRNVVFVGNQTLAESGGGMHNTESTPTLVNALFHDNSSHYGGGIYNHQSQPELINVTMHGNHAGSYGGGMYNIGSSNVVSVDSSIFWGNTAGSNGHQITNSNDSVIDLFASLHADGQDDIHHQGSGTVFSCIDCVTDDPLFVDPGNGNLTLMEGSPAIDAGNPMHPDVFPGGHAPIDLAGNPRVAGAAIDIGAYEWQPVIDEVFEDRFELDWP